MALELTDEQRARLTPDEAAQIDAYAQWLRGVQDNPISYIKNKPPISQDTLRRLMAKSSPNPSGENSPVEDFGEDVAAANEERDRILDDLGYDLNALEGSAASADSQDQETLSKYLEDLGQYEDPLAAGEGSGGIVSEAAGAQADARGIDAQFDALDRFKDLSSTEVTGEERFMYEQARMAEERDRRAAMDAALRDLEARGARSGGAEIAALTGAQDITSQNRLLGDLGTQANAQRRAMLATQGYGNLAGDIRDSSFREDYSRGEASDRVGMFNEGLMQDWRVFERNYAADERDRAVERAGMGRDARGDRTNRQFGRQGAVYSEKEDLANAGLGTEGDKLQGGQTYTELMLGKTASDRANAQLAEEDEDWIGKALNSNAMTSWVDDVF